MSLDPAADHMYYALAGAQALTGDLSGAHESLKRAIEMEPRNRIAARQDADFAPFANQPPFDALLYPGEEELVVDRSPLRVVAIGGGTGLSALLAGLKRYALPGTDGPAVDITAIVTVTDDGGSSGRLRREFDVLPPGDIRNCMVALSEDSALLSRLFQYRFESGRGLKGHSFGNLFLMALTQIMGDFPEAVKASSEVLKIAGRIFPATTANVALEATLANGVRVVGETKISRSTERIRQVRLRPGQRQAGCRGADGDRRRRMRLPLGPGSLFTSVIPNLLVDGIAAAIRHSPAVKAYFVNLMSQPGETTEFSASDHVRSIHRHAKGKLLDYAVVNIRPITSAMKKRYASHAAMPVENDIDELFRMGIKVMAGKLARHGETLKHDPEATAEVAVKLALESRRRQQNTVR